MRAVQVSWHTDPQRRAPDALLDAWPTLVDAAAAAARAGVDVAVVQAADADAAIERDGVRFEFVRVRRGAAARAALGPWAAPVEARMLERIAALRPDVLHQHGLAHPVHARALARRMRGVPLLVQDHASRPPARMRTVHRWGFGAASAVAFTARDQAAPFVAAGALRSSVRILELLESSTRFTPGDRAAAQRSTGIHGAPCLLWLGHLDANKDPLTVLRAVELAAESLPDIRLWLAYRNAPLLEEVRACIASSPTLRDRVTLLGPRTHAEVEDLLRAADFLVQGSRFEGSGYAVIEALACGTTPIVTDIVSFRRITANASAGALFPVGEAPALARALVAWATRDAQALRCAARTHFERALSFDVVGAELRAAYASLAPTP